MKAAIVTPTIGSKFLSRCVESVSAQTYKNLTHYIFLDGKEHEKNIWYQLENEPNVKTIRLEENVGKGWYGHRVYAACSFLVNADVIFYLDEDNWFEPDHVQNLIDVISEGNDWAYSFRKIYDKEENYLCDDNCESLGRWPIFFDNNAYHIDTSCFAIKRDVAVRIGHAWYGQWGADRQFFAALKKFFPNFSGSYKHTLCYRLDGNPNSVKEEFFIEGNETNLKKYGGEYPWKNPGVVLNPKDPVKITLI